MPVVSRNDPYGNYNFMVEIDGITQAGFAEVVMPEGTVRVIQYREGNAPNVVRKLPGPVSYGNVILRWGCTNSAELYNWWKAVVDGQSVRRNISIILLNSERSEVKRWHLREAWPVRYHVGDLNARGKEVLIEELEIAHEGFELGD